MTDHASHPVTHAVRQAALCIALLLVSACAEDLGIEVINVTPIANARVEGMEGNHPMIDYHGMPVTITLDGSASRDPDGTIKTYRWLSGSAAKPAAGGGSAGRAAAGSSAGRAAAGSSGAAAGSSGAAAGSSGAAAGSGGAAAGSGGAAAGSGGAAAGSGGAAAGSSGRAAAGMSGGAAGTGSASAGKGAAGASAVAKRAVPAGEEPNWPDDVEKPTVTLGEGVHTFLLWVIDDRGSVSLPDTLVITVARPLDPAVAECVATVHPSAKRECAACVCGVNDSCRAAVNMSMCNDMCWGLLGCIAQKCPDYAKTMDTSCVTGNCINFISGATAAGAVGPCVVMCPNDCR